MRVLPDDSGLPWPLPAPDDASLPRGDAPPLSVVSMLSLDEQARQSFDTTMDAIGRELEKLLATVVGDVEVRAVASHEASLEGARRAWDAELAEKVENAVGDARAEWERARAADAEAAADCLRQAQVEAERVHVEAEEAIRNATAAAERQAANALESAAARARDEMISELRLAQDEAADAIGSLTGIIEDTRAAERQSTRDRLTQLLSAVVRLDRCTSLKDALDVLSQALHAEAPGSMVLVVRGHELRRWPSDSLMPTDETIVALEQAGELAMVVRTALMQQVHDLGRFSSSTAPEPAENTRPTALAVPITLGSRPVAIICAPVGSREAQRAGWVDTVQILARHASRVLEALTAFRTAGLQPSVAAADASAPPDREEATAQAVGVPPSTTNALRAAAARYAHLLVAEIKLYCDPRVRAGREHRDLRERLHPEIDRARRLFQERVPAALSWRDELFEEELVRTLADGDASLLGNGTAEPV